MSASNQVPFDHSIAWDFLSLHHGLWYDFIETRTEKRGKVIRDLKGSPVLSDGFRRMYKAGPQDELGLFRIVPSKTDRQKVVNAIRRILDKKVTAASDTIEVMALDGSRKIVEVYVRELQTTDGLPIIVSMHSDLTVSNSGHWILPAIADRIGAFIFVKRWNGQAFEFDFCNAALARALKEKPEHVIGKSDGYFFDDDHLVKSYFNDDFFVVFEQKNEEPLIREESFILRDRSLKKENRYRRLLTFKTRLKQSSNMLDAKVLGISIDISEVTDVLRAVSELSDKAIYVKDDRGRYVAANRQHAKLLGKKNPHQVLHRTLEEVLQESKLAISEIQKSALLNDVDIEDKKVLQSGELSVVRTANLFDHSEWTTEKKRFFVGPRKIPHIVGISSPMFPSSLWHVLESMPQCVSVKLFDDSKEGTPDEFRYVWANRSYLDRHQFRDLSELVGMTDFSICKREKAPSDQWERFILKDKNVLNACKEYLDKSNNLTYCDWKEFVRFLQRSNFWEFREIQELNGLQRSLQTTKWAEKIVNRWFIIVVYSDVTLGDVEIRRYHRMTVHGINEMVSPIEPVIQWLSECEANSLDKVKKALTLLRHVREDAERFLRHHLDLFDLKVEMEPTNIRQVAILCNDLLDKRKLCSNDRIEYVFRDETEGFSSTREWCIDIRFLRVVIAEILLNSMKSVVSKLNAIENIDDGKLTLDDYRTTGWNRLDRCYKPLISIELYASDSEINIKLSDNGSATSNNSHRKTLIDALESKANLDRAADERLGIRFCKVAIERTGGTLSIDPDDTFTTIKLQWRLR
jgi:PAS domain-containing protein